MSHVDGSVHTSVVPAPIFMSPSATPATAPRKSLPLMVLPAVVQPVGAPVGSVDLMSGGDNFFTSCGAALVARGWSVFPQHKDGARRPGSVNGGMISWKEKHSLHERLPTQKELSTWSMHCPSLNVAAVLGAGSGHAFAVDIDVVDVFASSRIQAIANRVFGETPLRRVGRAPKIALIYRHAPDDALFYARRVMQTASATGETNGIEILCGGRPLTFIGRHHKTGDHFKWLSAVPLTSGPETAPLVTSDQVEEFLEAVDREFPFVASANRSLGSEGGTWGAASGTIKIPRSEGDQPVANGREAALLTFAARLVKANGEAVMAADAADQVRELSEHLAILCAEEFRKHAVVGDKKWPVSRVLSESRIKVRSAIRKVISGDFKPSLRAEAAAPVEKPEPTPVFRLADVPVAEGSPTVLLGVGDTYSCDEVTVFVSRTDRTTEEYKVGTVTVQVDFAAREAAKEADRADMAARRAAKKQAKQEKAEADRANSTLPVIRMERGCTEATVDAVEQALIASDRGLYQRGGQIVALGEVPVMTSQGEVRAVQAFEQREFAILEAMSSVARYEKWDDRKKAYATAEVPMAIAKTFQQRAGRWNLPLLTGFASAPTLRADGSILETEGYDARTGLVVNFEGGVFPKIPETPTKEQAIASLGVLKGLLATFPFVGDTHMSVALSCLLTATVRRSLRTAPLHAFTAPVAGSGKSKLADMASVMATGREAATIGQGAHEEEFEKRLGALLLSGEPVVSVDNCTAPVGGKFLCSALTSPVVSTRILGKSESPKVGTDALMVVNGNNLSLLEDMDRRFLLCKLDPACERPQLREFDYEPVTLTKARRPHYVVAALTVLRAYKLSNRSAKTTDLGSFEEWSGWIREALLWLGEADPVDYTETASLDVARDSLTAVLVQWHAAVGSKKLSVRDLIALATEVDPKTNWNGGRAEFTRPDFRESLIAVAGEGGAINTRRLARFLGAHADRIVGGLAIKKAGVIAGIQMWMLESTAA